MSDTSWLGFGVTGSITKTFLHFMPLSQGVGAPYPVNFSLTTGGSSLPARTINIEGARLSQPDGFRIEEAMPALTQHSSGLYYAKVEFDSSAHRLNLQASSVTVELQYQQSSVSYRPAMISQSAVAAPKHIQELNDSEADLLACSRTAFALRDPNLYPMIILINASFQAVSAKVLSYAAREYVQTIVLEPETVREFEPAELGLRDPLKLDCSSGSVEAELFQLIFEDSASDSSIVKKGAAIAAYLVYRNRNTRRIASVLSL